ncbi:MAG: Rossmann-like domain-containing protein [Candidatus Ranarchaeia archaeon]
MNLFSEMLSLLKKKLPDKLPKVKDIAIGLGYTGILLKDDTLGLSFTQVDKDINEYCSFFTGGNQLFDKDILELAEYVNDRNITLRCIGVAALNALCKPYLSKSEYNFKWKEAIVDTDYYREGDNVYIVGRLHPIIKKYKENKRPFNKIESDGEIKNPDLVIIKEDILTSTNLDNILGQCKGAREVILIGTSFNLLPDPFLKRNVTQINGSFITDPETAFKIIKTGEGARLLFNYARYFRIRKSE